MQNKEGNMRKYLILLALIFSFFSFSNTGYNDYVGYWVGRVKENNEYYLVEYAFVRDRLENIADKYLLVKVKDGLVNKVYTEVYSFENARSEIQKNMLILKLEKKSQHKYLMERKTTQSMYFITKKWMKRKDKILKEKKQKQE